MTTFPACPTCRRIDDVVWRGRDGDETTSTDRWNCVRTYACGPFTTPTTYPDAKETHAVTAETPAPWTCDGHSVGILIADEDGRILIGDRTDGAGAAPPAGHVYDEHTSYRAAARAEVTEETGLTVTSLTEVAGGWRANRCRRQDGGPVPSGHQWMVYRATVAGRLTVDDESFTNVRYASRDELAALTDRTLARVHGEITPDDWRRAPGIEPVWVQWLSRAGLIAVSFTEMEAIEDSL
jgi:8-oxo-dGTP pyrophosphatase MutT (NUDIX family)